MDQKQFQQGMKQAQQNQIKQEEVTEQRRLILTQCMTKEANERSLVKPEKALKIEDMILQNARLGGLKAKVDEQTLITYLEQMNEVEKPSAIKRKIDEDEDDLGIDENL